MALPDPPTKSMPVPLSGPNTSNPFAEPAIALRGPESPIIVLFVVLLPLTLTLPTPANNRPSLLDAEDTKVPPPAPNATVSPVPPPASMLRVELEPNTNALVPPVVAERLPARAAIVSAPPVSWTDRVPVPPITIALLPPVVILAEAASSASIVSLRPASMSVKLPVPSMYSPPLAPVMAWMVVEPDPVKTVSPPEPSEMIRFRAGGALDID